MQEEKDNLNGHISIKWIEFVFKKTFPERKFQASLNIYREVTLGLIPRWPVVKNPVC